MTIFQVTKIETPLRNIDPAHLNELMESIEKNGLKSRKTTLTISNNP